MITLFYLKTNFKILPGFYCIQSLLDRCCILLKFAPAGRGENENCKLPIF